MSFGRLGNRYSGLGVLGGARVLGPRTTPLRVSTFGDSKSNLSATRTTTDVSSWNLSFGGGLTTQEMSAEKDLSASLYGQTFRVGIGGISGQTTTQMIARSGLGASSTRKAMEDVIALSPDVVLYRGGSINDLTAFTPPITQANQDGVYTRHMTIVSTFLAAGIAVIDAGVEGYGGATNTAQVQAAIVALNARWKAAAGGRHKFIDPIVAGLSDGTGAYNTGVSYDGTHLSPEGSRLYGIAEAAAITQLFGASSGYRYSGTNLIPNANLSATGSQSYGTVGTSWAVNASNSTSANAKVETINGVQYQTCEFTPTADNAYGEIQTPLSIHGASPVISVSNGVVYGLECDWYIGPVGVGTIPLLGTSMYFDISAGTPRNIYDALNNTTTTSGTQYTAAVQGHISHEPITMPASSASLTASAYKIRAQIKVAGERTAFKLGIGTPRLIANAT